MESPLEGGPAPAGSFCLLALPSDVLLTVLAQPCLGPRELCHLELCCQTLKALVDDTVWRQAFLQHRRCNALRAILSRCLSSFRARIFDVQPWSR